MFNARNVDSVQLCREIIQAGYRILLLLDTVCNFFHFTIVVTNPPSGQVGTGQGGTKMGQVGTSHPAPEVSLCAPF